MRSKPVRLWVHKDFRKKIKQESFEHDMTVLELTKKLGQQRDVKEDFKIKKREQRGFDFDI